MKTKRVLALLLVLAMACALLAGCGGDEPQEPEHIELDRGAYEAYDEDDELAGYLVLTRSDLTAYDADGVLDETYEYEFDDETATYLIDGDEAFYADEDEDGVLTLTTVDRRRRRLYARGD